MAQNTKVDFSDCKNRSKVRMPVSQPILSIRLFIFDLLAAKRSQFPVRSGAGHILFKKFGCPGQKTEDHGDTQVTFSPFL